MTEHFRTHRPRQGDGSTTNNFQIAAPHKPLQYLAKLLRDLPVIDFWIIITRLVAKHGFPVELANGLCEGADVGNFCDALKLKRRFVFRILYNRWNLRFRLAAHLETSFRMISDVSGYTRRLFF